MNLWDVLFDFVFLDAFEDLRKPPSGIAALMRNSFLSRSMKEATLNNLIWSLIKAKRSRLQVSLMRGYATLSHRLVGEKWICLPLLRHIVDRLPVANDGLAGRKRQGVRGAVRIL